MANSVFVGNIPYGSKEEDLIQVLQIAGPVVSFRTVTDKETGKPKGYGFCQYMDEETARSALRNLNGHEFNGRMLRVDSAEKDKKAADPIAVHLAGLPRHHLLQVLSDLKAVAMHNKEQARQLLQSSPSLPRAILQALTILGQAPPQQQSKKLRLNNGASKPAIVDVNSLPQHATDHLLQQVLRLRPQQLTCVHEQQQVIELQHKHGQTLS